MSWKDIQIALIAYDRKEVNEWRRIRFIGWMQYATTTADKVKKPIEQFMSLPGDPKRDRGAPVDPKELVKRMQKMMYGNGNPQA